MKQIKELHDIVLTGGQIKQMYTPFFALLTIYFMGEMSVYCSAIIFHVDHLTPVK